jgi:hypothetical protein
MAPARVAEAMAASSPGSCLRAAGGWPVLGIAGALAALAGAVVAVGGWWASAKARAAMLRSRAVMKATAVLRRRLRFDMEGTPPFWAFAKSPGVALLIIVEVGDTLPGIC